MIAGKPDENTDLSNVILTSLKSKFKGHNKLSITNKFANY